MVNAAISGFAEVVRGSICPEQLDCCSILQILERRMWFLKLGRGQRARQVRQVTRKEALQYRYESPQHFWIWGWLDVNGRLTSMAPHPATSTPLEAGFRVKHGSALPPSKCH